MDLKTVLFEKRGPVALLTINRPQALNSLNPAVLADLREALLACEHDPEVSVVVLTGSGEKAFVAGADILAMKDMTFAQGKVFAETGLALTQLMEDMEKPVIAAVNGFALGGGCEIALACDIVYASERALFGQPEVALGIIPGFGGTQRLMRLAGRNIAKEWIFSGDRYTAQRAAEIGLVSAVFKPEELLDKAIEAANRMASRGQLAVRAAKRAMNRGADLPLERGLEVEKLQFAGLFGTEDQKEGMGAFAEKRKPVFKGR